MTSSSLQQYELPDILLVVSLGAATVAGLRRQPASGGSGPVEKEYAFEMATSTIRYGPGVTREVGMDVQNLGIKNLGLFTDKNVSALNGD